MGYPYEDQLVGKLQEREDLVRAISDLEKKKSAINEQVKQWMELNKLDRYTVEDNQLNCQWNLVKFKTKRKKVTDYEVLIKKLGDEANIFITESESETLKVTRKG
jgi:hypothetical protein